MKAMSYLLAVGIQIFCDIQTDMLTHIAKDSLIHHLKYEKT